MTLIDFVTVWMTLNEATQVVLALRFKMADTNPEATVE